MLVGVVNYWDYFITFAEDELRRLTKNHYYMIETINFAETNTVINRFMAELRDVHFQQNRLLFRNNLHRIGMCMAYEISKRLSYNKEEVITPLGVATESVPSDQIVLGTIFRAGLPFHQGFLDVFDKAENAFVSAYRYYKDKECRQVDVHIEYIAAPDLTGKTLIIADPMLATGESMELGYHAFLTKGIPAKVHVASVIASREGVEYVKKAFPEDRTTLWCASIDPELNEHSYIVPGLGDAGDLSFGEKIK